MEQKAYLAVTAMLNSFPQGGGNPDLTLSTYEAALRDVTSQAVIEAAQRFTCGDVPGQHRTFAPSIAEFVQEARRIAALLQYRGRPSLPKPKDDWKPHSPEERERMGFKMTMLSAGLSRDGGTDMVETANGRGLPHLIELALEWRVPVPDGLQKEVQA